MYPLNVGIGRQHPVLDCRPDGPRVPILSFCRKKIRVGIDGGECDRLEETIFEYVVRTAIWLRVVRILHVICPLLHPGSLPYLPSGFDGIKGAVMVDVLGLHP